MSFEQKMEKRGWPDWDDGKRRRDGRWDRTSGRHNMHSIQTEFMTLKQTTVQPNRSRPLVTNFSAIHSKGTLNEGSNPDGRAFLVFVFNSSSCSLKYLSLLRFPRVFLLILLLLLPLAGNHIFLLPFEDTSKVSWQSSKEAAESTADSSIAYIKPRSSLFAAFYCFTNALLNYNSVRVSSSSSPIC